MAKNIIMDTSKDQPRIVATHTLPRPACGTSSSCLRKLSSHLSDLPCKNLLQLQKAQGQLMHDADA